MRSRLLFLLAGAVAMLASSAAFAGTLNSATWIQTAQGFPLTRSVNGVGWSFDGTSTSTSVNVNINYFFTSTVFTVPPTPNASPQITLGIQVTQGGTQNLVATDGVPATANQGIAGTVIVGIAGTGHVGMGVNASMNAPMGVILNVPVSVGIGNLATPFTATFTVIANPHTITVRFYSWTTGQFMVGGLTSGGNPGSPVFGTAVTTTGSFDLDAGGAGMVTLISGSRVDIDGSLAQRRTASFTTLVLNFVPEPGTLLLLGAGALGLVLMGSRKR